MCVCVSGVVFVAQEMDVLYCLGFTCWVFCGFKGVQTHGEKWWRVAGSGFICMYTCYMYHPSADTFSVSAVPCCACAAQCSFSFEVQSVWSYSCKSQTHQRFPLLKAFDVTVIPLSLLRQQLRYSQSKVNLNIQVQCPLCR